LYTGDVISLWATKVVLGDCLPTKGAICLPQSRGLSLLQGSGAVAQQEVGVQALHKQGMAGEALAVWVDGMVLQRQQLDVVQIPLVGGIRMEVPQLAGGVVEVWLLALLLVLSSRRLLELPMQPVLANGEKKTHNRTGVLDIRMVSIYSPLVTGLYRNVSFADCIYRVSNNCLRCP
jgi:hypothetical protein